MFSKRLAFFLSGAIFFTCLNLYAKDACINDIEKRIEGYKLTVESKSSLLTQLRKHILSYAHLERKAALYDLPLNLYYRLNDDSIAELEDLKFFDVLKREFAKERDSHTRAYYPDYMSCRQASIPIEFRFFRDSEKDNSWGKVIVYEIKDPILFRDINVGDELVQYGDSEIKPLFEKMRGYIAQSNRGFYENLSGFFLNKIDGRYLEMPSSEKIYLAFKDWKSGEIKEIEVPWQFDYSKCSKVSLFKGIAFPEKKKEELPRFEWKSKRYGFEKIENPDKVAEKLFTCGIIKEKGAKDGARYGFIKFFDFNTYEDEKTGETINEFIDKSLISLAKTMNIFSEKKVKGLIIDLRWNSGGWIEFAHHIARVFSRDNMRSVKMQWANGEESMNSLLEEIGVSEKEVRKINSKGVWSGFPYTRDFFNWDNYKIALENIKGTSLRLTEALPHFKSPADGLNPLSEEEDFPKLVMTGQFCLSSCDMFVAMFKENKLGKTVGETTMGTGGMIGEPKIELEGILGGKKKIASKFPFVYAYANVLTPDGEFIEDTGVKPDLYYRSDLDLFRQGAEDDGWMGKVSEIFNPPAPIQKTKAKKN